MYFPKVITQSLMDLHATLFGWQHATSRHTARMSRFGKSSTMGARGMESQLLDERDCPSEIKGKHSALYITDEVLGGTLCYNK